MRLRFPKAFLRVPGRAASCLLLAFIAALAGSCAMLSAPPPPPALDVTGLWEGRSEDACVAKMTRCGGVVRISLTMFQNDDASITGTYRCAPGNMMCRNLNFHGRIAAGEIRGPGVSLRVMFEDVSSCIFNGLFSDDAGGGTYICLQGGIVERGYWQVRRAS
jgi:hypothetical protein